MRHHLKFRNFRPAVRTAAEGLFEARPWALETDEAKLAVGQAFADAISAAYGVRPVAVTMGYGWNYRSNYVSAVMEQGDALNPDAMIEVSPPTIKLRRFSIIKLMELARVHVLAHDGDEPTSATDPVSWACSLFYTVRPAMFRARVREGRISAVNARETFSAESWEKLTAANLTLGNRLIGSPEQWRAAINGEIIPEDVSEAEATVTDEDLEEFFDSLPDAEETDEPEEGVNWQEGINWDDDSDEDDDPEPMVPATVDLDSLNRDGLRALAAEIQLPGRGTMNAPDLRDALRARQGAA